MALLYLFVSKIANLILLYPRSSSKPHFPTDFSRSLSCAFLASSRRLCQRFPGQVPRRTSQMFTAFLGPIYVLLSVSRPHLLFLHK